MPVRPSVSLVAVLAAAALASACAMEEPTLDEDSAALGRDCSTSGCGANSPVVAGVPFWDLHRFGQRNAQGFGINSFQAPAAPPFNRRRVQIDVVGTELVGRELATNAIVVSGSSVQGSILFLNTPSGPYEIHVVNVGSMAYWTGLSGTIYTYELKVRRFGSQDELAPLCSNPPGSPGSETYEEWPGGNRLHAVLFPLDRYLPVTKEVRTMASHPQFVDGWMNVSCAGSAPAKLLLMRHTTVSADPRPQYQTTRLQRQAMLRMYTSAVCPSGKAYTYAGERLRYKNTTGLVSVWNNANTIEAVWTADGATCLEVHRLDTATVPDQTTADKVIDDLMLDCGGTLPTCTSIPGFHRDRPWTWPRSGAGNEGYLLSANPFGS
jgi:hypothetical protein